MARGTSHEIVRVIKPAMLANHDASLSTRMDRIVANPLNHTRSPLYRGVDHQDPPPPPPTPPPKPPPLKPEPPDEPPVMWAACSAT